MTTPTTTSEAIEQAALSPSQVQVKGTMVTGRSADDLIKIANYQAAQQATTAAAGFGLRFATLKPPGAG